MACGWGRPCRGALGTSATCCALRGCAIREWIVCREEAPGRALDAVRTLTREKADDQVAAGNETEFASAVCEAASATDSDEWCGYPPDRLVDTWVGDLVWGPLNGSGHRDTARRWRDENPVRPAPPAGPCNRRGLAYVWERTGDR